MELPHKASEALNQTEGKIKTFRKSMMALVFEFQDLETHLEFTHKCFQEGFPLQESIEQKEKEFHLFQENQVREMKIREEILGFVRKEIILREKKVEEQEKLAEMERKQLEGERELINEGLKEIGEIEKYIKQCSEDIEMRAKIVRSKEEELMEQFKKLEMKENKVEKLNKEMQLKEKELNFRENQVGSSNQSMAHINNTETRFVQQGIVASPSDVLEQIKYTKEQLIRLREVVSIPEETLKVKQELDAEFGEDLIRNHGHSHVEYDTQNKGPTGNSRPDTGDWRKWTVQSAVFADGRSMEPPRDANRYGCHDFFKPQIASSQWIVDSSSDGFERVKYTKEQLIRLREMVSIPEDILKVKKEVDAEFGIDPCRNHGHGKFNNQNKSPIRYSKPGNHDWRKRIVQFTNYADGRSWDTLLEAREGTQYSPQEFLKLNIASNQKTKPSHSEGLERIKYTKEQLIQLSYTLPL